MGFFELWARLLCVGLISRVLGLSHYLRCMFRNLLGIEILSTSCPFGFYVLKRKNHAPDVAYMNNDLYMIAMRVNNMIIVVNEYKELIV